MAKLKNLNYWSDKTGIPANILEEVYSRETNFHKAISGENDFDKRQALYTEVYTGVDAIMSPFSKNYFDQIVAAKFKILNLFKKDVEGKSILDVGSGSGAFLYAVAKSGMACKELYGLDVKAPKLPDDSAAKRVNCFEKNVVKFELPQKFDVIISDNVYEHIAPSDNKAFMQSLSNGLEKGGKLILIVPHKYFGPWDWTKLEDDSNRGSIPAECVHLNETTYRELIHILKENGFGNFVSPMPFIALNKLNQIFPNIRLNSNFCAFLESSWLIKFFKRITFKRKSLLRMEVIIVAEKKH